jgi:starvation-inducible DNA-binding protein
MKLADLRPFGHREEVKPMIHACRHLDVEYNSQARPRAFTGFSPELAEGVIQILNRLLADEIVLYAKTRDYHWNLADPQFHDLHKLFESQYEELARIGDSVAERARKLGGLAHGSLEEALDHSQIKDTLEHDLPAEMMIENLVADHEAIIRRLREDIETCADKFHDMGTNNFLTDLMEQHETFAWMLRACLEERESPIPRD